MLPPAEKQRGTMATTNRYHELSPIRQADIDSLINAIASEPTASLFHTVATWLERANERWIDDQRMYSVFLKRAKNVEQPRSH
jgi:hypothetical protein